MKPPPFRYVAPRDLEEVLDLLHQHGDEAKVLAGGQSLVPMLNFRLARPAVLVDINRVGALDGLQVDADELSIRATTRQRALEAGLPAQVPADSPWLVLAEAARHIGHSQIRARGTVGGSLAHGDPAAELPAVVSALGATLVLRSRRGVREVDPEQFFEGFFTTCLAPDEVLTEIRIPAWPAGTRGSFAEVSRRRGDFAQVAVAAVVTVVDGVVDRAGIAIAGVASGTLQARDLADALVGREPTHRHLGALAADYAAALQPPPDVHGPADYRRALTRHLLLRTLTEAAGQPAPAQAA